MINGPYEITQAEWDNWDETMQRWKELYVELEDIMHNGGWYMYEVPSNLRLYHNLVHANPDGFVTRPTQIPGSLKLCVYVLSGDTSIIPASTFQVTGGKPKPGEGYPCCTNTRIMKT